MDELYKVLTTASVDDLITAKNALKEKSPGPMNRMLDRISKEEALKKYHARKAMTTVDVPGTSLGV